MKFRKHDWRFAESPLLTRLRALQERVRLVHEDHIQENEAHQKCETPTHGVKGVDEGSPGSTAATTPSPQPSEQRRFKTVILPKPEKDKDLISRPVTIPAIPAELLATRRVISKVSKHSGDFRKWSDTKTGTVAKGRFTEEEDALLRDRIQGVCQLNGWNWGQIMRLLVERSSRRTKKVPDRSLWCDIALALPDRHIESVVMHVQSQMYQWARRGKWSPLEDKRLIRLVRLHGEDWKLASTELKRYWRTCRDHYKDLEAKGLTAPPPEGDDDCMKDDDDDEVPRFLTRVVPPQKWTYQEDKALLRAVQELTGLQYPLTNIPWQTVRRVMGSNRTPPQIRRRYTLSLLAQTGQLTSFSAACRRTILRYLLRVLEARPDVAWQDIQWRNCLPFWPRDKLPVVAMRMLRRQRRMYESPFEEEETDWWKPMVKRATEYMQCGRYEEQDKKTVGSYLQRLRQANEVADEEGKLSEPSNRQAEAGPTVTAAGVFDSDDLPRDTDLPALISKLREQRQALHQAEREAANARSNDDSWLRDEHLDFERQAGFVVDPEFFQ